jgi:DNA helicase-2/ATP-dependent DNA helicase PcrA
MLSYNPAQQISLYKYPTRDAYQDEDFGSANNSGSGYSSGYAKRFLEGNAPKVNKTTSNCKYKSGMKVKHVKFGEGTVIMVKNSGDNLVLDVAFKGVGIKSLSVKYAPMEII